MSTLAEINGTRSELSSCGERASLALGLALARPVDFEGGLSRGPRADQSVLVGLAEQAGELLALLFVFSEQAWGLVLRNVAVKGISSSHDVDFAEDEDGEDRIRDDGDD